MTTTSEGPGMIPGIYHYCDRWCRRCPFTARCLQFRLDSEKAEGHTALEGLDIFGVPFWQELALGMERASRLIRDAVSAAEDSRGEGADPAPPEPVMAPARRSAREHPASRAALAYAGMADGWFMEAEREKPVSGSMEAVEVIRHYRYLIYAKVVRAVDGRNHALSREDPGAGRDSDGSAKIALLSIDRSIGAWSILYGDHPGKEDRTLSILLHLDRLRRSLELVFPDARAFQRPGFDTEPSSSANP
ncbi:hypothetical protein [Chlorobium sp. N1]|uniref:hypothetical protein n=1 Tax=Chlorobium sp. N1 TaxID=2491138 RepID=UPI00103E645A|nr:hypothetical protein [Chlorobium sp. N1]TCD47827.1 hypothetical protein E0L29_05985 [Chlorobium sp. N1]